MTPTAVVYLVYRVVGESRGAAERSAVSPADGASAQHEWIARRLLTLITIVLGKEYIA